MAGRQEHDILLEAALTVSLKLHAGFAPRAPPWPEYALPPDPNLIAAQDSARAALAAAFWNAASFWCALVVGTLSVVVNGAIAWLAFDGPRRQRAADKDLAEDARVVDAAKVVNLQLGGLKCCDALFGFIDSCRTLAIGPVNLESHASLCHMRANLEMNIRILKYFLSKDIHDAAIIHLFLKTSDAAGHVVGALSVPGFNAGPSVQAYVSVGLVATQVLSQCEPQRITLSEMIAERSAYIDQVMAAGR